MEKKPTFRIIPRLDIKGPNLVKGISLEGLRVLGSPDDFAEYYYENGADELFYQDVVASLYERNSLEEVIRRTAEKVFIPITVSGGLRSLSDVDNVLKAGADKVCINTACLKRPEFISEIAEKYGSSTVVVAVETIKQPDGNYLAFVDNGREHTGVDALEWISKAQELGAGEILITSVDREGTGEGFDLELIEKASELVSVPLIVHGGAGKKEDILELCNKTKADGVAIASVLHYEVFNHLKKLDKDKEEGNRSFLSRGGSFSKITSIGLSELKKYLFENDLNIRLLK